MTPNLDPIENIVQHLKEKSCIKQATYDHLKRAFEDMFEESKKLVTEINSRIKGIDKQVTVAIKKNGDQEFQVKVAADLLVFVLHTNIVTFEDTHAAVKGKYIEDDRNRRYFGQIMIYNFMADSVKYNRANDPGYLLGRIMINYENHFLVEGEGQLNFLFKEISLTPLSHIDLDVIVKLAITIAAENDLYTRSFKDIKKITLQEKNDKKQSMVGGHKIGFQMSNKDDLAH